MMRRSGFGVQNVVITLIIVNVVVYLFTGLVRIPVPSGLLNSPAAGGLPAAYFRRFGLFIPIFALVPVLVLKLGWVWQLVTYMFLHGGFFHLFFNMYALLLFGRALEDRWGKGEFFLFYMFSGVGAGMITLLWNGITNPMIPTLGASGAIFGLVLAFGLEFPDAVLLLFFLIPMRAKYAAFIFGGIEVLMLVTGTMSGIGHLTHLAGLLFGYIYYVWRIKGGRRFRPRRRTRIPRSPSPPSLSRKKQQEAIDMAETLKKKLSSGSQLDAKEERFLGRLREGYNRFSSEMCRPDEFDPRAENCRKCRSLYACLYRYVLEIK